ncbi:MAG: hypothetical protein FWC27_15700 [Firmicutes bacterium]|nr:hypothetical protein [Bacillota bacterium]
MKRLAAVLLLLFALLLCACGERAVVPTTAAQTITDAPTATQAPTTRALQPLPENCRFVSSEEAEAIWRKQQERAHAQKDLSALPKHKTLDTKESDSGQGYLVIRDERTGEEHEIAGGAFGGAPWVGHIIDGRYILWQEYIKGNDYHGIYDAKENRHIALNAGGCVFGVHDGYIYAMSPKNYWWYGGDAPGVYKTSLRDLDKADVLECGENLLKGLLDVDWSVPHYTRDETISPNYHFHAARTDLGVYVFDLQERKLVFHLPAEAIPGNNVVWREPDAGTIHGLSLPYLTFADNNTLYCHGDFLNDNPGECAIEIKLP